uniref:O43_129 component B n=1 Tax=synthetic construct TaxID=32630 RepID=UPI0030131EB3
MGDDLLLKLLELLVEQARVSAEFARRQGDEKMLEEVARKAEEVARKAESIARKARKEGNLELALKALEILVRAAHVLAEIARERGNEELQKKAHKLAKEALRQVIEIAIRAIQEGNLELAIIALHISVRIAEVLLETRPDDREEIREQQAIFELLIAALEAAIRLEKLKEEGAPPEQIERVAEHGLERLKEIAKEISKEVDSPESKRIAYKIVAAAAEFLLKILAEGGATPEQLERVTEHALEVLKEVAKELADSPESGLAALAAIASLAKLGLEQLKEIGAPPEQQRRVTKAGIEAVREIYRYGRKLY